MVDLSATSDKTKERIRSGMALHLGIPALEVHFLSVAPLCAGFSRRIDGTPYSEPSVATAEDSTHG